MVDSEGKFSGRDFLYLLAAAATSSSPVLALRCTVKNGAIVEAERVEVVGGGASEGGILKLETAPWPEKDEYGAKSFSLWHPGLTELEEVVLMQVTKVKLLLKHQSKPFRSVDGIWKKLFSYSSVLSLGVALTLHDSLLLF